MKKQQNDDMSNGTPGFSAFGGHPLVAQNGGDSAVALNSDDSEGVVATLATLGVEDVEQLIALAAVPEVRGELESVLGLRNGGVTTLLNQVQGSLPEERISLLSTPVQRDLALGVMMPTPEMISAAEASAASATLALEAVALPPSINLIPYMSPIRNQASRGTCVAFALTALNEYILRRRGLIRDLSEQHLYYETKLIDGAPSGCGTWQVKAVLALRARGQCREVIWPYNPSPPCNNHGTVPAGARPDGLSYTLPTLAVPARSVADYKAHMAKQRPVTISIPVYNSWYLSAETRRSGRITMRVGSEQAVGGHAVCLVGYQDTAASPGGGYFIVRNSWNGSWGTSCPYGVGYGTIPYQYITNDAWEAFTAVVPGLLSEDATEEESESSQSTVTIQVKPNITITISAT